MYTEKQAHEAILNAQAEYLLKKAALSLHEAAINEQAIYNLPYRVLLDYKRAEHDFMEIEINPYYPYPDIPKEYKPPMWRYDKDGGYTSLLLWLGTLQDDEWKEPDEIRNKIDECQRERDRLKSEYRHVWNLTTEQGRQQWLYYFGIFLLPYAEDIPHWDSFNMFGDVNHTEQELNERKTYFTDLIKKCHANPDIYKHGIQCKQLSDYDKFDFDDTIHDGYMWDSRSKEPPHGKHALDIMYRERERLQRYYKNYEHESKDVNTETNCYKVEQIIQRLERGNGSDCKSV